MANLTNLISFAGGFGGTDCENYLLTGIFDDYGINYFTTNETINRLIYLGKTLSG